MVNRLAAENPAQLILGPGCNRRNQFKRTAATRAPSELIHPGATALNKNAQHDNKKHTGDNPNDCRNFDLSSSNYFEKSVLNDSAIMIAAGPIVTRNNEGKMKNTRGNTSLTVVLAAISSICWIRLVRIVSE